MIHPITLTVKTIFSKIKSQFICFFAHTFIFFIIVSCQSVPKETVTLKQKKVLQSNVEKSCFQSNSGGFLANVSAPSIPSVSWEGEWAEKYSVLHTQLLDPTGQVIQMNSLSSIVNKFGALGLRRVMCGHTVFESKVMLEGHKIILKNSLNIIQETPTKIIFEGRSEFYYGLFHMQKSPNTLFWRGHIENKTVTPELIRFGTEKDFVMLDVIDYN